MEDNFIKIGEIIKSKRIENGYTQQDIANLLSVTKSAVSKWESGGVEQMGRSTIQKLSQILDIPPYVIVTGEFPEEEQVSKRFISVPLLGSIAAGTPILAEQNIEDYFNLDKKIKADFCLRINGDSMININIMDGDIVFIKKQEDLENGEVGAVLVEDSATLKRFYRMNGEVYLQSENPAYKPIVISGGEVMILGKMVASLRQYK